MEKTPLKATWLYAPALESWQKEALPELQSRLDDDPERIWVASSGTQSVDRFKFIGLSKQGVELSAEAVNRHLKATRKDRWLIAIPKFHVGGFLIPIRAQLTQSKVFELEKWDVEAFIKAIKKHKISLTSLVPTQVFDLIQAQKKSPSSLRAIVVGGGALSPDLYSRARSLGWPVLPSYGLTECASQVATAELESLKSKEFLYPDFQILEHVEIKVVEQRLFLRSDSLCDLIATVSKTGMITIESPLREGWLATEDLGEIRGEKLHLLGRRDDIVKVLGELVSVPQVENDLATDFEALAREFRWTVLPVSDPRGGHRLVLAVGPVGNQTGIPNEAPLSKATHDHAPLNKINKIVEGYNSRVQGPFRIKAWFFTSEIPTTSLGKIKKAELKQKLKLE